MTRNAVCVACVSLISLGASLDLRADPVTITNGGVHIDNQSGLVATSMLLGTDGFRFESHSAVNGLGTACSCEPGPAMDFNGSFEDASGTARVMDRGRGLILPVSDFTANVRIFTGTVTLPPVTPGHVVLRVPFGLDGSVSDSDPEMFPNGALVVSFTGRGTARLDLVNEGPFFPGGPSNWHIVQEDYNFAPTPEPGSLTLLAGGLVGLIRMRQT